MQRAEFDEYLSRAEQSDPVCFIVDPSRGPEWLEACLFAARGTEADRERLMSLPAQVDRASVFRGGRFLEPPGVLLHQTAQQIMLAYGCKTSAGVVAQPVRGVDSRMVRWRDALVAALAELADRAGKTSRWLPHQGLGDPPGCALPVLLVGGGEGVVAKLRLWRLDQAAVAGPRSLTVGDGLCIVPAPRSAIVPQVWGQQWGFAKALDTVLRYLGAVTRATDALDPARTVIAWDIDAGKVPCPAVEGDSAGAAFALGALWLLRDAIEPAHADLKRDLARLDAASLLRVTVTASLRDDGQFRPVGGVAIKREALWRYSCTTLKGESLRLMLAPGQKKSDDDSVADVLQARYAQVPLAEVHDVGDLVRQVCDRSACDEHQAALRSALLGDGDTRSMAATARRVHDDSRCTTLEHYLLRRWAHWRLEQGEQLHLRFVPLSVETAARRGPGPAERDVVQVVDGGLEELFDPAKELRRAPAYVLRGAPGSGKTVLLRHREQTLCVAALRALAAGVDPEEVPLYVPLLALPAEAGSGENAEAELQQWLRERVREEFGSVAELAELLEGRSHRRTRLRLLLDGLNELKTSSAQPDHLKRGRQVLLAWRKMVKPKGREPLAALVATSGGQPFSLLERDLDPVLDINVLPLNLERVEAYLRKRFHPDEARATKLWDELRENPDLLNRCRTPRYLDEACQFLGRPDDGWANVQESSCSRGTHSNEGRGSLVGSTLILTCRYLCPLLSLFIPTTTELQPGHPTLQPSPTPTYAISPHVFVEMNSIRKSSDRASADWIVSGIVSADGEFVYRNLRVRADVKYADGTSHRIMADRLFADTHQIGGTRSVDIAVPRKAAVVTLAICMTYPIGESKWLTAVSEWSTERAPGEPFARSFVRAGPPQVSKGAGGSCN